MRATRIYVAKRTALVRGLRAVAVLAGLAMLSGCGLFGGDKPPPAKEIEIKPPPPDGMLDLLVTASPLINPGADGAPATMVVRLYELSAPTPFTSANFRQLWENDAATLGPAMLGKHEIVIAPGGVEHIKTKLNEKALMIGVVAGFRDVSQAKWRALLPLQGEQTLSLKASLKTLSVDLGPQDAP